MYSTWADDFMFLNAAYTATKTNAGTIAATAFAGGALLFTTDALAGDQCSLQLPAAQTNFPSGKKVFYACRLRSNSISGAAITAGLIQTTTTPGTVTDGIWFSKASGSLTNLSINTAVGSAIVTTAIPTSAYTLANNTDIDLSFHLDRVGNISVFVGQPLFGYVEQSGGGTTLPTRGRCLRLVLPSLPASTVNLNPTLAIASGTAGAKTMTADFAMASVER
jgi:hypothetical protein